MPCGTPPLESPQAQLPASLQMTVLTDRTTGIRSSVHHVEMELVLAIIGVVLVIFLFVHSLRATLIASLAVPISLIGSCGAMYLLGYSLNNLSLMALTIATGFVVDDAIVMIENISRYLEKGMKPMEAALKGASEIGFTIISLTVSLVSVGWDGNMYDCDFNLARGLPMGGRKIHVSEMEAPPNPGSLIATADHCYTCTAGSGFT